MERSVHGSQVGFSQSARLGSIRQQKSEAENHVALRVYAEESPGYLRGAVFTTFNSSQWISTSVMRGIPLGHGPGISRRDAAFGTGRDDLHAPFGASRRPDPLAVSGMLAR